MTTKDGSLHIILTEESIHDLTFRSGMLQSWNKFWCVPSSRRCGGELANLVGEQLYGRIHGGLRLASWEFLCARLLARSVVVDGEAAELISNFHEGVWTMGNLGRAGYGATNDGVWPYSYDTCDV